MALKSLFSSLSLHHGVNATAPPGTLSYSCTYFHNHSCSLSISTHSSLLTVHMLSWMIATNQVHPFLGRGARWLSKLFCLEFPFFLTVCPKMEPECQRALLFAFMIPTSQMCPSPELLSSTVLPIPQTQI